MPDLPPALKHAASTFDERRITLVIGAGCSRASPTNLPVSRDLSLAAHTRLVNDGVLDAGECPSPEDLSAVADSVYAKLGRQYELVERIDRERLRSAVPNPGYECAVALLLEGVLRCLVTLNFDMAASHALATVGAEGRVSVVKGPEEWQGATGSLILYLHRNVEGDPEKLVMRTAQIDTEWRDGWEAIAASAMLAAPVTAFVGLGTQAAVLIDTVRRIKQALPDSTEVFLASGQVKDDSAYASLLGIDDAHYVRLRWNEFMGALCARTVLEYRTELLDACASSVETNAWPETDYPETVDRLTQGGIVRVGRVRARWLIDDAPYTPLKDKRATSLVADLVLAIARIEGSAGATQETSSEGLTEFRSGDRLVGRAVMMSGGGTMRWHAFQARAVQRLAEVREGARSASVVIYGGVPGPASPPSVPDDILRGASREDIADGEISPEFFWADAVLSDPGPVLEAWR
jgi:hypothetical protein